jgi:hypothetical protein
VPKPSGERGQPNLFRLLRDDFTKPKTLVEGINPIRARGGRGALALPVGVGRTRGRHEGEDTPGGTLGSKEWGGATKGMLS